MGCEVVVTESMSLAEGKRMRQPNPKRSYCLLWLQVGCGTLPGSDEGAVPEAYPFHAGWWGGSVEMDLSSNLWFACVNLLNTFHLTL